MARRTTEQRFRDKVIEDGAGCWIWQGWISSQGYGQFTLQHGVKVYAHRWAYEHFRSRIPEGLVIDHLCRNRACCNPEHLEPVSLVENLYRGNHASQWTHCPRGHEFTDENTRRDAKGHRVCRACEALRKRESYAHLKATRGFGRPKKLAA